eukprot:TRINITY_DN26841_c0_g1_i2.p4 TRINITY_DN26841_c0_g1~~TRINITY_DN26841_c0_g1_i2.p4  ORF type:complete len:102 (-),score=0.60 TRINITY_DN26841_c0_g1_i2:93-398(-)
MKNQVRVSPQFLFQNRHRTRSRTFPNRYYLQTTITTVTNMDWAEKYRPMHLADILGNGSGGTSLPSPCSLLQLWLSGDNNGWEKSGNGSDADFEKEIMGRL